MYSAKKTLEAVTFPKAESFNSNVCSFKMCHEGLNYFKTGQLFLLYGFLVYQALRGNTYQQKQNYNNKH